MKHVLVTGGAGYVGSHCAKALASAGYRVTTVDSLIHGHADFVKWGPFVAGDIRDGDFLRRIFLENSFEAVVHFAALAYVGESVVSPELYYDANVGGTLSLLNAMREANVRRLVFSSTCAVYGIPSSLPITEDSPLSPINPYVFTKLVCEKMMEDFDKAHGLKSARLRYFNAAGADPDGDIGEDHSPETHLIPSTIFAGLGIGPALKIFGSDYPTQDGTAVRDYVHVCDLASAHVKALDYLMQGGDSLAVNLGTGRGVSVREIVEGVEAIMNRKVPFELSPARAGDPPILVADPTLASTKLNWLAERSDLGEILRDAIGWHRKRHLTEASTKPSLAREA
jgi:UDP-glucose-4-epimerase GalE